MTSTPAAGRFLSLAFLGAALVGAIHCGSSDHRSVASADASDDLILTAGDSAPMLTDGVADVTISDAAQADVDRSADSFVDSPAGDGASYSACAQGSDCPSGQVCVVFPEGALCRADPCAGHTLSCTCAPFACAPNSMCQSASAGVIQCHRNG